MASRVTVQINLPLAHDIAMDAAERGVRAATLDAAGIATTLLSQPGSGRVYGNHRASAPGEPPAPDTGRLRGSVQTEVYRTMNEVIGEVSVNTEYAAALELGTERTAARPYLSRIPREFAARIADVFKRFAR